MKYRSKGFTLIEVMIVVVIVGILASLAFPSYQEHVRRGYRAAGQALLSDAAARQEKFFTQASAYATSKTQLYGTAALSTDKYTLTISNTAGDGGYTLTATPTFTDVRCGALSLNAKGDRAKTGTDDLSYCWR
ncbi:type IV pilin protein [Halopseudomonas sp. Lyrl_26]|uniref:type IV pilin protein n=1 Tax=Halopseudomonas sp. Lyrl_26 TaxID=3110923 RepID=UPI003F7EE60A